ncbi:MAG: 16S rRNA (cytidine(1402)-2'-O)-methyltransferase [Desulfatiglandales bacterium]
MKKSTAKGPKIQNPNSGTLYVVSTPIGNLEDVTLRALRVLKDVDLIAAENVQHSKGLCRHYGIKTKLTRYNQHNKGVKGPDLIRRLKSGLDIALVTNAGTPGVSDPGVLLINQAAEANINISPIPGPSAVVAALSISGLRTDRFVFLGFLSNKAGKRKKELRNLISEPRTMVFFEAPHRIQAMLMDLKEILGDRQIVVLREMTKVYEEARRGPVSTILDQLEADKVKGEFTLVVAGKAVVEDEHLLDQETQKNIKKLMKEKNMSIKDIAGHLSGEGGLTYRRLYKECLSIKREMSASNEVN